MQSSDLVRRRSFSGMMPPGLGDALRRWFGGPRGLVILGIALIAAGLAAGWGWLTAVGLAPLILSIAPCAAMCALGACAMSRGGSSSCSTPKSPPPQTANAPSANQPGTEA